MLRVLCSIPAGIFPLKPFYQPKPIVQIDTDAMKRQGAKIHLKHGFSTRLGVYRTDQHDMMFREALLKDKSLGLENKKSQYEKRKDKRVREKFYKAG